MAIMDALMGAIAQQLDLAPDTIDSHPIYTAADPVNRAAMLAHLAEAALARDDDATASEWIARGLDIAQVPSDTYFRLKQAEGQIAMSTGDRTAGLMAFRAISDHRIPPEARDLKGALDHLPYHIAAATNFTNEPESSGSMRFYREVFMLAQLAATTSAGRALNAAVAQRAVDDRTRVLLTEQDENARELKSLSKAFFSGRRAPGIEARMKGLRARQSELRKAIDASAPEMSAIVTGNPVRLQTVADLLRDDEVMVVYATSDLIDPSNGGPASFAFALSRENVLITQISGSADLIEASAALRCSAAVTDPNCGDGAEGTRGFFQPLGSASAELDFDGRHAHRAYAELLEPIEAMFPGKSRLIVVPDRALIATPFHLMIREPTAAGQPIREAKWLIRDMSVEISPSVLSFYWSRKREGVKRQEQAFLGIGDPLIGSQRHGPLPTDCHRLIDRPALLADATEAIKRNSSSGTFQVVDLGELPDARCELEGIAAQFQTKRLLLHYEATETKIKDLSAEGLLKGYSVVSFATHGLVAGEIGVNDAGLVLTPPENATSIDDGLLTSTEIANLELEAELVILSACNTASGDSAQQEGLSGLAGAFFVAGAQSLVVSHWPVYSEAAVRLTSSTIDMLRSDPDITRADALRQAMLAVLDDPAATSREKHPGYWGPFMIVGDGLGI